MTDPAVDRPAHAPTAAPSDADRLGLLEAVFHRAPTFLHVLRGPDFVFELANPAYYQLVGHRALIGRPAFEALPEAAAGGFPERLARVMATREPFVGRELPVTLARTPGAAPEERRIDLVYLPLVEPDGTCERVLGHGTDVTEQVHARRHSEAALDAERRRLAEIVRLAPAFMAVLRGTDHVIELTNAGYDTLVGGRDVRGRPVAEALPEAAAQGFVALLDWVLATGEPFVGREVPYRRPDAAGAEDVRAVDVVYQALAEADGTRSGVFVHGVDVTDQVRARREVERLLAASDAARAALEAANAAMRVSEGRFRQMADAVPQIVWTTDPDGRVEFFNRQWTAYTGAPYEPATAAEVAAAFVHPDDGPATAAAFAEARRTGGVFAVEHRIRSAAGAYRWFLVRAEPYRDPATGAVARWFGASVDIHDRKVAEAERARLLAEVAAERERLRALILHMPAPVALAEGPEHRFTLVNAAYRRVSGGRDVTGLTIREAFPEIAGQGIWERFDEVYATGAPWVGPETPSRYDRDGTGPVDTWFDLRLDPVRDVEGRVTAVLNFAVDVTDQVRARREVERLLGESEAARGEAEAARRAAERAQRKAEAANRAKGDFLAVMSHELRTPLNAIGGYAQLLELGVTGPVTDAQRAQLGRIQASQHHLLGLVNEVLDLAKVDAGAVRVDRAAVRAGDTVDAALALVRPQAAAKALALADACGGASEAAYVGDEPRVRQILVNLLSNAVKFTPADGRVAVTCALDEATPVGAPPQGFPAPGPYLALRVTDTGVGIAPDQRERIFEPFAQAGGGTNPYTRAVGGTGLGLTISRRLARLMGGDLTVESAPGVGSTFTLWLPAVERRAAPRPATPARGGLAVSPGPATAPAGGIVAGAPADGSARGAGTLARLGGALVGEVPAVVRDWVARLRADPAIPYGPAPSTPHTDAELEDHAVTVVTEVALALRTLAEEGDEPGALRDGTAILGVLAERHGAQRARLGWPAAAIPREFALLGAVLDAAVERVAAADADPAAGPALARARALIAPLLAQAERGSLGGFRLAAPVGAPPPRQPA